MPDKLIIDFINEHHLLTLATSKDNLPYCCNVFYVYDEINNSLVFSSDIKTRHAQEFTENSNVSGTIALETTDVRKIQGVQLLGEIKELKGERLENANKHYIKIFPYAEKMELKLWILNLSYIKMTHNKFGFGRKLIWGK